MKRVVIDMQAAQNNSATRGLGRYTRELTKSLIENSRGELEIFLSLNGALSSASLLRYFENVTDRDHLKVWYYEPHLPMPAKRSSAETQAAELFYEWFHKQFQADILWLPSYFDENAHHIVSNNFSDKKTKTIITIHDLIPLLNQEKYLTSGERVRWYQNRLDSCRHADFIITDSLATSEDLLAQANFNNINMQVVPCGYNKNIYFPDQKYLETTSKNNYLLYVGAADARKNLPLLIQAFSQLKPKLRHKYRLILAGKEPFIKRQQLLSIANSYQLQENQIKFPGFVSDDALRELMQRARIFVFPSQAEGFGLPPLEAMACGAPTLVADNSNLTQIAPSPKALFATDNPEALSQKIAQVLDDQTLSDELIQAGLEKCKMYSWEKSAQKLKKIMLNLDTKKTSAYSKEKLCFDLKKTGYISNYHIQSQLAFSIEKSTLFNKIINVYIDVSNLITVNYTTGIQRVTKALLLNLKKILLKHQHVAVRAVYFQPQLKCFCHVKQDQADFFQQAATNASQDKVDFYDSDILLMPEPILDNHSTRKNILKTLMMRGIRIFAILYDLIPVEFPEFYAPNFTLAYQEYLRLISQLSGVIAISQTTQRAYEQWLSTTKITTPPYFINAYFYLGADVQNASPSQGLPADAENILHKLQNSPTLLMVATIEPRKKHAQILAAVETLWAQEKNINLVFVGRNGWQMEHLVTQLKNHPQINRQLFWLTNVSDEYLEQIYKVSTGVICASLQEGYGLPIIEAASYNKPLLLRDIPIFREVAGANATYFQKDDAQSLANTIDEWLETINKKQAPASKNIKYLTWEESANMLSKIIAPNAERDLKQSNGA